MNIEWLKNKAKEKFYPITHAKAVLFGENNKTVNDEIELLKNDLTKHTLKKLTDVSFLAISSGNSTVGTNSIYEETFINNGIVKKSYKIWFDVQFSENTISIDLESNLGSSQELLHSTSIITGYIIDGSGGVYADITGITDSRFYNMYLKFGKELQADAFYNLYFEFNSYTEQ